jgi:flagellar assembly protein FliH
MTFDELERTAYINDDQPTLQIIEICREHFSDLKYEEHTEIHDNGYEACESDGYDRGYDDGKSEGYDEGFKDGKSEGHDEGFEAGYAEAMNDHRIPY